MSDVIQPVPIAIDKLLEQCVGSVKVAELVLKKLEEQLARDLKAIEASVSAGDAPSIARTAHALKGAAGAVAATALHAAAASVEALAKSGTLDAAAADLARLSEEAARCAQYIPTARQSIAQGSASKT